MSDRDDLSTIHISQWLLYWKVPFIRIDRDDSFFLEKIEINQGFETTYRLYNNSKCIVINDIKASWYRRGRLNILLPSHKITEDKQLNAAMDKHLNNEKQILESFFYYLVDQKPHIGTFGTGGMNKLVVLHEAANLGIKIPETWVASTTATIAAFKRRY